MVVQTEVHDTDLIWQNALTKLEKPEPGTLDQSLLERVLIEEAQRLRKELKGQKVNPAGGSNGKQGRDGWCTPRWLALLIGWVNLDPCSNQRSHIDAGRRLSLENGDDGLADGPPGTFTTGKLGYHGEGTFRAPPSWAVFVNPPYAAGQVIRWIRHWLGTRFIFLLRWDPSTRWFSELIGKCTHVWFPKTRINFEAPPGVESSSNPFPHALYLRHPTPTLLARLAPMGYLLEVDSGLFKPQGGGHDEPHPAGRTDQHPDDGLGGGETGDDRSPGGDYTIRSFVHVPYVYSYPATDGTFQVD